MNNDDMGGCRLCVGKGQRGIGEYVSAYMCMGVRVFVAMRVHVQRCMHVTTNCTWLCAAGWGWGQKGVACMSL